MKNMKMTNDNVKGLLAALTELSKADSNFTPRVWFTLAANRKELTEKDKLIEEARLKLVEKHGSEKDGVKSVDETKMSVFIKEYGDILSMEVDVDLTKILLKDLEKGTSKMKGVDNIYLVFEHLVEDENRVPAKSSKKK